MEEDEEQEEEEGDDTEADMGTMTYLMLKQKRFSRVRLRLSQTARTGGNDGHVLAAGQSKYDE